LSTFYKKSENIKDTVLENLIDAIDEEPAIQLRSLKGINLEE